MRFKAIRALSLAAFLIAAVSLTAFAVPQGRQVPLNDNILQYFASNGVDTQYLDKAPAGIPSDVLSKIDQLQSDPMFSSMLLSDFRGDAAAFGDTLYLQIGDKYWTFAKAVYGSPESFSAESIG